MFETHLPAERFGVIVNVKRAPRLVGGSKKSESPAKVAVAVHG